MKKYALLFAFFFSALGFIPLTQADSIENLQITQSDRYVNIAWDALSDEVMDGFLGYAVQWSPYVSQMKLNEPGSVVRWGTNRQNSLDSLLISTIFDRGTTYYVRVYVWNKAGEQNRERILRRGSKIIKFDVDSTYQIKNIEEVEPNDPVIADTPSSNTSSSSSSGEDDEMSFKKIRFKAFDDHMFLYWSRANIASSDADGRIIIVSEKDDLSDPVLELTMPVSMLSAKIENLTPEKEYYVKGYFYKNQGSTKNKWGESDTEKVKTSPRLSAYQKIRNEQLQRQGLMTIYEADIIEEIENDDVVEEETEDEESFSPPSSPVNPSNNLTPRPIPSTSSYTRADILAKIQELERELNLWRNRLNGLSSTPPTNTNPPVTTPDPIRYPDYGSPHPAGSPSSDARTITPSGRTILSIQERMAQLRNR